MRKAKNGNLGRNKDLIAVGDWEDIPEADKVKQQRKWYDSHHKMATSNDLAEALGKAQLDTNKRFKE